MIDKGIMSSGEGKKLMKTDSLSVFTNFLPSPELQHTKTSKSNKKNKESY